MIEGVKIKNLIVRPDDRGFFMEVLKFGEETYADIKQTSYTETYPGVIKAFHWHKRQTDIWCVVSGMAQVVLYDLREDSKTKGMTDVLYSGDKNYSLISIPPGVVHGYKVLGNEKVSLFYHTTEAYDPNSPDEERIAWNDPSIGFNWTTQNR